jgi:UDPglucose 6-dehydrogenase
MFPVSRSGFFHANVTAPTKLTLNKKNSASKPPRKPAIRSHRICIVGLWHQATVLSACFADMGYQVTTVGDDAAAVASLNKGYPPVHEPKLEGLLLRNLKAGRLSFTSDYARALSRAEFVFIAIDTPVTDHDEPELMPVFQAAQKVGQFRSGHIVLCVTSQVPVGTSESLAALVRKEKDIGRCDLAYIPEFLRLGEAVRTFFHADRFVIGSQDRQVAERVADLYRPLKRPMLLIGLRSAEMAKHASNTYLATAISFINEISDLCDRVEADATEVARAMKLDRRIGAHAFLSPGLGFAGGTLGRDIRALQALGRQYSCRMRLMDAVMSVNRDRALVVKERLLAKYNSLKGLRIGILGLTYKSGTNTLRRSIAKEIIAGLVEGGAEIRAYDPLADLETAGSLPKFTTSPDPYTLAEGSDALVLVTEWDGILGLDLPRLRFAMRQPVFIDTRNLFDPEKMSQAGFTYSGIGRGASLSRTIEARSC